MKSEFISISGLARALGVHRDTIRNRVKSGNLPQPYTILNGGASAPKYFRRADVVMLLNEQHVALPSDFVAMGTESQRYDELNRRAGRMAKVFGRDRIERMLAKYSVTNVSDLEPRFYETFRSELIGLSRNAGCR